MNEALELACKLYAYARGDEYQRVAEEAAAILCSQHAEIEGWKKDQKENLRNQCDLHAEIERLKTVPMKYRRMTFNAELQNEVTALHAERERNLDSICVGNNIINSLKSENGELYAEVDALKAVLSALRAENQKLRSNHERLQKLVDDGSASGLAYTASLELEAENQNLRKALESVATMSEELSISRFARAALEETRNETA